MSSWEHISLEGKAEETMYTGVVSGQNSRMNCLQIPHGVVVGAGTSLDSQRGRFSIIKILWWTGHVNSPGNSDGKELAGSFTLRINDQAESERVSS